MNICQVFYDLAIASELTGDETKWPDVLAYRWPVDNMTTMGRLFGLDADLIETLTNVAGSLKGGAEDTAVLKNVVTAAFSEQEHRRTCGP
jgi:hypothetical protein